MKAHKELVYLFGMQLRRREVDAEFKALSRLTSLSHHDLFTWTISHFTVWGPDIADDLESFIKADPLDRYSRLALATLLSTHRKWRAGSSEPSSHCPTPTSRRRPCASISGSTTGGLTRPWPCFRKHRRATPGLPAHRGRAALMRGDRAAAIRHFQDALSEEPYDRVSLSELGKVLLITGDRLSRRVTWPGPGSSTTCTN